MSLSEFARTALSGLLTLADVDRRDPRFSEEQLDALTTAAPDKIGPWIVTLNEARLADYAPVCSPASAPSQTTKVGRNEPCPCGSAKKYKKCCGLN
jgi:uncharacterized protein